jgi:hypothetical protein
MKFILIVLFIVITACVGAVEKGDVTIFYKQKRPSLMVKAKIDTMLATYTDKYDVNYFNIEEEASQTKIHEYGLPETHFPFAILINGKYTAKIDDKEVAFVHFPRFMHGIGRHEADWTIADVEKVLNDNSLLAEKNILPEHDHSEHTSDCED